MQKIRIDAIDFGDQTCIQDHRLIINEAEMLAFIEEIENVKKASIALARPGEKNGLFP